ncbi:MAG: hypothetical protein GW893_23515 [Armatimonadetes bacterium]|nr:hypothetical protein [Armatimonadota bacterium]
MATSLPGLLANYVSTRHMLVVTAESALFEKGVGDTPYFIDDAQPHETYIKHAANTMDRLARKVDEIRQTPLGMGTADLNAHLGLSDAQRSAVQCTRHNDEVYVKVFADLFVPEFREAERYWAGTFFRAYHWAYPDASLIEKWNTRFGGSLEIVEKAGKRCLRSRDAEYLCDEWEERLLREVGPAMRDRLHRAMERIGAIFEILEESDAFLRLSGAEGERRAQSVKRNLEVSMEDLVNSFDAFRDPVLVQRLSTCPTLTMEVMFDAEKQHDVSWRPAAAIV